MTKLLNRGNIFVVVRVSNPHTHVLGVFSDMDEADDYRGAMEQKWLEKVGVVEGVEFQVQMTTYYGRSVS